MTTVEKVYDRSTTAEIMSDTERIDRLEKLVAGLQESVQECRLWEAAHDGKVEEKWRNQEATNAAMVAGMAELRSTLAIVGRRVWMGVGGAMVLAALGAFLGSVISIGG